MCEHQCVIEQRAIALFVIPATAPLAVILMNARMQRRATANHP